MPFFLAHGYRVIAHDRRGHGRSAQVSEGNNMDRYADDLAELVEQHLDLHDAIHVGHSAGGGEVARYIGRHGESRVAKAVLISAVTPSVLQTDANPAGVPQAAFEALQAQLAANRSPAASWQAVESGLTRSFGPVGRRGEWQRHVERGALSARTADGWCKQPSASTRSRSPVKPLPAEGLAPPTPSSLIRMRTTPSRSSTSTRACDASACLAMLASASAAT